MKTKFFISFLISAFFYSSVISADKIGKRYGDSEKDKIIVYVLKNILSRYHYVQKKLDDDFSEHVYNEFINNLDPSKRYFTQKDILEFSKYKYLIDDQIKNTNIDFYKLVYNRFLEKIDKAKSLYKLLLKDSFDYNSDEEINIDYEKIPFAKNDIELRDIWRKQLKLSVISRVEQSESDQDEKVKKDSTYKKKDFADLEKEARAKVLENMNELYNRIDELESSDWYSSFLNSIVSGFDPHTTYMSPRVKSRFDQDMSGRLEGIGARLQKKGMYTHVVELISGGPAWKQGELESGDIILKVAQGKNEPLDIVGMRLDDAIKFIKGKKGTEVRLTVKKIDGSLQVISIIRDVVELEETFVKSSIVEKNEKIFGIVNLPKFYIDFNDPGRRDAAKDMAIEIERLKKEGVDGLIIDLRDNGGGSLQMAIEIGGLFIDKGPIVQVKYRGEAPTVKNDVDEQIQWAGPLVVMVNEFSASASEIFAAAMQDYKRGIVIGGKQTYGKGTVQNILPINRFYEQYPSDLGSLKMTIQKFYRISGGSTQKEGVYSDIALPSRYSYMEFGERDLKGALPWDKVTQANYKTRNSYSNWEEVVNNSQKRIFNDEKFKKISEYAKWLKRNQEDNILSLNYNEFKSERHKKENQGKEFKEVFKFDSNLIFNSPKYENELFKKDTVLKDKRFAWHKSLKKDIYMNEALNVLSELKMNKEYSIVKK
ncbi:MAG TPA: tail-specific protease [Tenacibaculum sp.]|nr:tail-specific protease [Tenacibaculum sp.]